ncbi:hypothetical protein B10518_07220 [Campylobacter jejuni]|nr:hypothetical protein B10518_07220 [Campylobacter jejuni]BEJ92738.1 hypothetical protein B10570_08050 [Campylobacter jejuni]BEK01655.1 hypothetical protein B10632_07650 [Campylobacter jejuni]GML27230.1 hypothetical protein B10800_14320 [Campylobacter jejuni]GML35351.1 hypothetical protein B10948_09100 [Campylobacter jejuni]
MFCGGSGYKQGWKNFYISEHSFKDNQVYDSQAEIFKKINGKISMLLSQNTLYQI